MFDKWNLQPIYEGFDDPAFAQDLESLKRVAADIQALAAGLPAMEPKEGLTRGIALQEQADALVGKLYGYSSLRQAADTKNPEAGSAMGRVMAVYSDLAAPNAAFQDWASKLPNLMELVDGDENLRDYHFLFANLAEQSKYLLEGRGEEIMAKLHLSGGDA